MKRHTKLFRIKIDWLITPGLYYEKLTLISTKTGVICAILIFFETYKNIV